MGLGDATHPDNGHQLYIVSLVMVLIAGLCVVGRLAARFARRAFGMDDYTIVVSLVRLFHPDIWHLVDGDAYRFSPLLSPSPSTSVRTMQIQHRSN